MALGHIPSCMRTESKTEVFAPFFCATTPAAMQSLEASQTKGTQSTLTIHAVSNR